MTNTSELEAMIEELEKKLKILSEKAKKNIEGTN